MTVRAIINEGIGPGASIKYVITLGFDIATPPAVTTIQRIGRRSSTPNAAMGFVQPDGS